MGIIRDILLGLKGFPTKGHADFIESVSSFCEKNYGFPVRYVFSSAPSKRVYVTYACSQDDNLRNLNECEVKQNLHYLYGGTSAWKAFMKAAIATITGKCVYVRHNLKSWSQANQNVLNLTITPDFFTDHGTYGKNINWRNVKVLSMIGTLIHEAFHHHLWSCEVRIPLYVEEALATALTVVGARKYLTERKNLLTPDVYASLSNEADRRIQEMSLSCRDIRSFHKKRHGKELKNLANFLLYLIYRNGYTEKYLQKLMDDESVQRIICEYLVELRAKLNSKQIQK